MFEKRNFLVMVNMEIKIDSQTQPKLQAKTKFSSISK